MDILKKELPNVYLDTSSPNSAGTEDFSEISQLVPTNMFLLCAGKTEDGYSYPLHHPKCVFDVNAMVYGVCLFVSLGVLLK